MATPPPSPVSLSCSQSLVRAVVLLLLLFLIVFGAIPHYLTGSWSGSTTPKVEGLKQLQAFTQGTLNLQGWTTLEETTVQIGESQWEQHLIRQVIGSAPPSAPDAAQNGDLIPQEDPQEDSIPQEAIVLLRAQKGQRDRPQVEWTDLRGDRQWREDSRSTLQVGTTTARWFRAWWLSSSGTVHSLAAVQWYAWPVAKTPSAPWSGHWSSNVWFWQDWQNQWQGRRLPWIAVSVLIPIEPLGEIAAVESEARSLVEAIQAALATLV